MFAGGTMFGTMFLSCYVLVTPLTSTAVHPLYPSFIKELLRGKVSSCPGCDGSTFLQLCQFEDIIDFSRTESAVGLTTVFYTGTVTI